MKICTCKKEGATTAEQISEGVFKCPRCGGLFGTGEPFPSHTISMMAQAIDNYNTAKANRPERIT